MTGKNTQGRAQFQGPVVRSGIDPTAWNYVVVVEGAGKT